ncbi:MAG: DUF4397 domain-containing protein [Ignavibacteriales bacterium]|nr:MAG: DUF4397 domain-containing protein [Ignavibacteriales bacterium]
MRLKFKEIFIGLFIAGIGLTIYGCIEEPTIEPVKRPFSEIRVVNLSNNVDNMRVVIDNAQPVSALNSLPITGRTPYFELKSGVRNFKVYNQSNDLVFEKDITVISYDRTTIIFAGYFEMPGSEANTFTNFEVSEGEVLQSSAPAAGRMNVYIVNTAAPVDTFEADEFTIKATYTITGGSPQDTTYESTTDVNENPVALGKSYSIGNASPGDYLFHMVSNADTSNTIDTQPLSLNAGFRYYLYIHGNPNSIQFFLDEVVPQPTRSK